MTGIPQNDIPDLLANDIGEESPPGASGPVSFLNPVVTVGNCSFAFVCSKRWSALTADPFHPDRRFCETCQKNVFWCNTPEEFARRGHAGECVAIQTVENHELVEQLGDPGFDGGYEDAF